MAYALTLGVMSSHCLNGVCAMLTVPINMTRAVMIIILGVLITVSF